MIAAKAKTTLTILTGILIAAAVVFHNPISRNRAYVASALVWERHWPIASQKDWLRGMGPALSRSGLIEPTLVEVQPGIRFILDPNDYLDQTLLMTGSWESDSWEIVDEYLPTGGTFVDVGAHVGYYSVKAARKVGEKGAVVAIEPNPRIVERLRTNVELSDFRQVISIQPVAAFDHISKLTLFLSPGADTSQASLSAKNASVYGSSPGSVTVEALPIDDIIERANVKRVDVIKLDIEGAELKALRGANRTLKNYRPVLVVETIEHHLRNMGDSEDELRRYLESLGFSQLKSVFRNVAWIPSERLSK